MELERTKKDNIEIINLVGRIDSSVADDFEAGIMGALDEGGAKLVLRFKDLDYISSAGLRVLLMTAKRLKQGGGSFVLCEIKANIKEVLEVSGFASVLTLTATFEEALEKIA